jgi:hypothetical protein
MNSRKSRPRTKKQQTSREKKLVGVNRLGKAATLGEGETAVRPDLAHLEPIERWFVSRGIPHFHVHYRARTDVWTRASPILPLWFVAGALNGLNRVYGFWKNVGTLVFALIFMFVVVMVANRLHGQRPVLSRPKQIGPIELALLAVSPSIPPVVFGRQWRSAIWGVILGVLVLTVIYFVTSYGLIPMLRWALGRLRSQIGALGSLFVRALPLVLLFVTFLFINAEVWQVAGLLFGPAYWVVLLIFFALGAVFLLSRLPADVKAIGHFDSWDEVRELVAATPAADLPVPSRGVPDPAPASWREWVNVGLVMLFSRAVQITLVGALIGTFFVLFGVLAVPAETIDAWTGRAPHILATFTLGGRDLVLTEQLLRVAGFLSAFTGLYFTVYLVTDQTFREEFREDVVSEVRTAFGVRAIYLAQTADS